MTVWLTPFHIKLLKAHKLGASQSLRAMIDFSLLSKGGIPRTAEEIRKIKRMVQKVSIAAGDKKTKPTS